MELPDKLKKLYKHWGNHVSKGNSVSSEIKIPPLLEWFIKERIGIWEKKTKGESVPYTEDKILSKYRFCNIFREFDRQTIEFHTLLSPIRDDFPLWLLNMFYFRMIARTETVRSVGMLSFNERKNKDFYKRLMTSPRPRFGTPYVFPISTIQRSSTPTRESFIVGYLPKVIPKMAKEIASWKKMSVYDGVEKLLPFFGYNLSFLWTEVLIDVAYQYPEYIDLFKRFPIGHGSLPTFKSLNKSNIDHSIFAEKLGSMRIPTDVTYNGKPLVLSSENWEGIGCEFRKHNNLKVGKGRKRLYSKV